MGITPTWSLISEASGAHGVASEPPGWNSGARGAHSGSPGVNYGASGGTSGALEITQKVIGGLGGVTSATWLPSKVTFPIVEEAGVALGTTTSMAETSKAVSAVMSSTWSSSSSLPHFHYPKWDF